MRLHGPQDSKSVKETISQKLVNRLSHLDSEQIDSLIQRAKQLKKRSGNPGDSLDSWVERVLRKDERAIRQAADVRGGIIISTFANEADVETNRGIERVGRGNHVVVPGDEVDIGEVGSDSVVVELKPRKTKLSRPDVDNENRERLIVANVDVVVIVVSVVSPPLHPRLIDRYLVAIQNGGADAIVCVNKIDLPDDPNELSVLAPYRAIGIPIFECSTVDGRGIEDLRKRVQGKTMAFVGHSGVGKSSLVNAFAPELGLKTGGLIEGYGRGAHTTTVSSLHRLGDGTTVIDTPGIRSFGLWATTQAEIDRAFPEFATLACRFRNCSHTGEPGCGVVEAVETGQVSADRYETFLRLSEELT